MCSVAAASISLAHTLSTHSPTASTERKNVIVFSRRARTVVVRRALGRCQRPSPTPPPIEIENKPSRIAENESLRQTLIATPAPRRMEFGGIIYCACSVYVRRRREKSGFIISLIWSTATGRNHPDSAECKFGCRAARTQSGLECVVKYAFRGKSCLRIMFPATLTRRFIIHSAGWKFPTPKIGELRRRAPCFLRD